MATSKDEPVETRYNENVYKCIYCDFCSDDCLCDVRDHIFVSHLRRNHFSCVRCAFGSVTKDDVADHCLTHHPGTDQTVNEDMGHSRSIVILETHGDVRLVGMVSGDNIPLFDLPINLQEEMPERSPCDASGIKSTVPSTTSMLSRTNVKENSKITRNIYTCKKCDFSRERRCLVREHVAHVHLRIKRFGCPYCPMEHTHSNSIRDHIEMSHPRKKVHCIKPMMLKLKLVSSHITITRSQPGGGATTLSNTPKQRRRKKQGNGSGLELRENVRMGTRVGDRSPTTSDVEPALDDACGTCDNGKSTTSQSSSSDTPVSTGNVKNSIKIPKGRLDAVKSRQDGTDDANVPKEHKELTKEMNLCIRSGADQSHGEDDVHPYDKECNVDKTSTVTTSEAVGAVSPRRNNDEHVETRCNEDRPDGDDQSWWRRHVETDHNNHKFCCTLCKYTHTLMSALKRHVSAVHLGFKPFACKYCNFSAKETRYVRLHINMTHPGRPFDFVRRKYSERYCDAVHSSSVVHRSTAVGRRNTLQGTLSTAMGQIHRRGESGLTDTDAPLARTNTFTEVNKICTIEQTPSVKPELTIVDSALNVPQQLYVCIYCDFCSQDRLYDVRDHIFVSHLRRNHFSCVHCAFGSMTKYDVAAHCLTHHPGKEQTVNEDKDHSRSIIILETHGDVRLVGMLSNDNVPLIELPTNLQEERGETRVVETSGVSRLAVCETSGAMSTVPNTTSTLSRTCVKYRDKVYTCKKCEFSRKRRCVVREHVAYVHLGMKRFGCPYCAMEHSNSNSIRNHIRTSHPEGKIHLIYPMMQKLKLVSSHIIVTRSQPGVNATTLSNTPKQQRRKKQGNGSGLELRENVRMGTCVGNRSPTTSGVEPALDDSSGTRDNGKSTTSRSSSSDTPELIGNVKNYIKLPKGRLDAVKSRQDGTDDANVPKEHKELTKDWYLGADHSQGDDDVHQSWWRRYVKTDSDHKFCCTECKYQNVSKWALKRHISAMHLRFKPFACKYCNFSAMETRYVRLHTKKRHPGLVFGFVRRKYSERYCDVVHSSDVVHGSTAVGRRNTLQGALSERAASDAGSMKSTVPSTTSTLYRTNVKVNSKIIRNIYKCKKCEFSRERRCLVREHVAYVHLGMKRFGCPYCAEEHSLSNSIRKHIKTLHPGEKVHCIKPMQNLQLVSSHITITPSQPGGNANTLSDMPKQQNQTTKQGKGSGLDLRKNVRMRTLVGNLNTNTPGVEPALEDASLIGSPVFKTKQGRIKRSYRDDGYFTGGINYAPVKKSKCVNEPELTSTANTDGRATLHRSSRVSVNRTSESDVYTVDCSSSDVLGDELPWTPAIGAVESSNVVIDRFHCDLCEFACGDFQLFDEHALLFHRSHTECSPVIKSDYIDSGGTTGGSAVVTCSGSTVNENLDVEVISEERKTPTIYRRTSKKKAYWGSQTCDMLDAANIHLISSDPNKVRNIIYEEFGHKTR